VRVTLAGTVRSTTDGEQWVNICEAETVIAPSPAVREELGRLADRFVSPAARVEEPRYIASLLDETDRLREGHDLPVRFLPPKMRAVVMDAERVLFDQTLRLIRVARWRLAIPGPHQPLDAESRAWHDGTAWRELPFVIPSMSWPVVSGALSESWRTEIERLVAAGSEPFGQELYREASVQRADNPRSAVVIGLAAVEVGVIGTARALAVGLPVDAGRLRFGHLMNEVVPRLAERRAINGRVLLPPPTLIDTLFRARRLRNRLVHGSARTPANDAVNDTLEAVRNLLLFLDFYAGHGWALATADARLLGVAARAIGMSGAGDLLRAAWRDASTISPFMHPRRA
jgi:hypothetical protein